MASGPNRQSTLLWRKSRASGGDGGCVEVAATDASVLVRDSRDRLGTRLAFDPARWRAFVRRIKDGKITPG
jgi:hypothetical protein